ncbi:MAG: cation-translocating P-type ATPase, partial [Acidimicrobiia bacterium]
ADLPDDLAEVLAPMALCSDATLRHDDEEGVWRLVGDPTEGALVVRAATGGVDAETRRGERPRVGEVPFDSAHKLMATLHDADGGLRMYAKGAPDAILDRSTSVLGPDGQPVDVAEARPELEAHNARLAEAGMRVLAVARRDLTREQWEDDDDLDAVSSLTFLALVGIVDPPREEARDAIDEAEGAGIAVKMITGDHATTARSIGQALNLGEPGEEVVAVTGRDLDAMSDDELSERIEGISVFARVSPEHKLRLVAALQKRGHVVAMTGDGVNDAPALRRADMGIAMGITGTEVTKEAATMVLADDNFATIVEAVRRGRTIYDNIVKFVRFQLSTTLGFATIFLVASILGIASGKPFTAIAILWVNIIMDGPPAMALGLDPVDERVMDRKPRPRDERILTRPRWIAIGQAAVVMAAGTLAVLAFAPGPEPEAGVATVAGTMAFNTFVLYQFFNILNVRSDQQTVFRRATLRNGKLWIALAAVLLLQVAVTHVGFMQSLFDTTSISATQWLVCIAVGSTVLLTEEVRKAIRRSRTGEPAA